MKISSAQFYNSVRVDGRERQLVKPGLDGVHPETTLEYVNGLIIIKSPIEQGLVVVGMTNTRSFRLEKDQYEDIKQEKFVFSREKPIPYLDSLKVDSVSSEKVETVSNDIKAPESIISDEKHETKEPVSKKKGKSK